MKELVEGGNAKVNCGLVKAARQGELQFKAMRRLIALRCSVKKIVEEGNAKVNCVMAKAARG